MKHLGVEFKRISLLLGIKEDGTWEATEGSIEHNYISEFNKINDKVKELKEKIVQLVG